MRMMRRRVQRRKIRTREEKVDEPDVRRDLYTAGSDICTLFKAGVSKHFVTWGKICIFFLLKKRTASFQILSGSIEQIYFST